PTPPEGPGSGERGPDEVDLRGQHPPPEAGLVAAHAEAAGRRRGTGRDQRRTPGAKGSSLPQSILTASPRRRPAPAMTSWARKSASLSKASGTARRCSARLTHTAGLDTTTARNRRGRVS